MVCPLFSIQRKQRRNNMVYVMSDIHGNAERFNDVMSQIDFQPEDTLYILGDAVDRYPDGIKIIVWAMKQPNVKMLLGNHEYMMLEALHHPILPTEINMLETEEWVRRDKMRLWYSNNGQVTHEYLKHIRKTVRQEIFEWLDSLPVNIHLEVNGQKYILSHGGIEESYNAHTSRYDSVTEHAVWLRHSESQKIPADTILIFGHTPTIHYQNDLPMRMWRNENYINIDCGAGYGAKGRLCCLRLDDMQEFYSEI